MSRISILSCQIVTLVYNYKWVKFRRSVTQRRSPGLTLLIGFDCNRCATAREWGFVWTAPARLSHCVGYCGALFAHRATNNSFRFSRLQPYELERVSWASWSQLPRGNLVMSVPTRRIVNGLRVESVGGWQSLPRPQPSRSGSGRWRPRWTYRQDCTAALRGYLSFRPPLRQGRHLQRSPKG